jgi:hypothetical protein
MTPISRGLRSAAGVAATQTAASAPTGTNTRAAPIKAKIQIPGYPALSILNVPLVHSTTPLMMKAAHIARGVKRVRDF